MSPTPHEQEVVLVQEGRLPESSGAAELVGLDPLQRDLEPE
jgi:hypothetical protein